MTGTKAQLYNGIILLGTFFGCRLIWGTGQSIRVYGDMLHALNKTPSAEGLAKAVAQAGAGENVMVFAADAQPIPVWLVATYMSANVVLNGLNWFWFFKMIAAVKKRFTPASSESEKKEDGSATNGTATGTNGEKAAGLRKRRSTIENMVPDSDELRDGTIQ
jgi:hypothetical protein